MLFVSYRVKGHQLLNGNDGFESNCTVHTGSDVSDEIKSNEAGSFGKGTMIC